MGLGLEQWISKRLHWESVQSARKWLPVNALMAGASSLAVCQSATTIDIAVIPHTGGEMKYKVTVSFEVEVVDNGMYPDKNSVKQHVYDSIEIPGYMLNGLVVIMTGATIEKC